MAGLFLLWRASNPAATPTTSEAAGPSLKKTAEVAAGKPSPVSRLRQRLQGRREPGGEGMNEPPPEQTEWEKKVDVVLLADLENPEKGRRLMAMMSELSETARVEVAQEAVNLLPDAGYGPVSELLTNAQTSEAVLSVLMQDVLQRGNELKLPLFLQIARTDQHPLREEAHGILETYLQEDLGNDWPAWERKLAAWLKNSGTFQPSE